jgi:glyoxylase-like metal-dependent hydrolase (beta-lactamase superfamily II)
MPSIKIHDHKGPFPALPSHVHGYVVELPNAVVVVDATSSISSSKALRQLADSTGKPISAVLITHGHPDHFTGLVSFADLPIYASDGTLDFAKQEDALKWRSGKFYLQADFPDERVFPNKVVADGESLTFDGVTFTYHNLGPGESADDGMWIVQDDAGAKHVFLGDTICNDTHAFFGDGNAENWITILDRLSNEFAGQNVHFYVGHGESPAGYDAIAKQKAYVKRFFDFIKDMPRELPPSAATIGKVMAHMKEHQPTEMLFFLLGYELDMGMERHWRKLDTAPLTDAEMNTLVTDWFTALNDSWPLIEALKMVSMDGDLRMVFPDTTVDTLAGFEAWWYGVSAAFFNEDHIIKETTFKVDAQNPTQAEIGVKVHWKASERKPMAPKADRLSFLASQTWKVKRSTSTGKPVIVDYVVYGFDPIPE